MPKVSVIIPVYGVEKYIERCARSLFEQTLDEIEYLFINDCTQDNSVDILKQVLKDYPSRKLQVKIHQMEKNSGQAVVRHWGMTHATGEYIIHCDSDDWVDRNLYDKMYACASDNNSDVVICDYIETDSKSYRKEYNGVNNSKKETIINDMMYMRTSWSLWNKMFKRSIISNIVDYPKYSMGEDMAIVLQLIHFCKKISYTSNVYYYYFQNDSSITKQKSELKLLDYYNQFCNNASIVLQFWKEKKEYKKYRKGLHYLSFGAKLYILPLLEKSPAYYKTWKSYFPYAGLHVIVDSNVPVSHRIKAFFLETRIYKYYTPFIKVFKRYK